MNLVESLLKADAKKVGQLETDIFKSKKLAKVLGKKGSVDVEIQEIPAKRMNDIISFQFSKKGEFDISKSFDAKALCAIEGVTNPNLKDENLLKHFGCATPKDLAIKLFGTELNSLSDAITKLSGYGDEDGDETEIKN